MGRPAPVLSFDDLVGAVLGEAARHEPVTVEWHKRPGGISGLVTRPLTPEEVAAERAELARKIREFERDNAARLARRAQDRKRVQPNVFCACGCWLEYAAEDCPACQYALLGAVA